MTASIFFVMMILFQCSSFRPQPKTNHRLLVHGRTSFGKVEAGVLALEEIAAKWITTARNGVPLTNINGSYVDESFEIEVERNGGLGLELEELWASQERFTNDGRRRGLVLISGVLPNSNADRAVAISGQRLQRGDTVTRVDDIDVEGLDFDATVEALASSSGRARLVIQRVVRRQSIDVTILDVDGSERARFPVPSGGNLRLALLYNGFSNSEIYDDQTMRFDAVANTGSNCGGEGTCGTCLVAVQEGSELLIPPGRVEKAALAKQRRPSRWRWSCRCTVGLDNRGGKLVVQLKPQSDFKEERNRIVGL